MKKFFIIYSMFCLFFLASCSVKDDDNDEIIYDDTDQTESNDDAQSSGNDITDADNSSIENNDADNTGTGESGNGTGQTESDGDPQNPDNDTTDTGDNNNENNDAGNGSADDDVTDDNDNDNGLAEPDGDSDDTELSDIDMSSDNDNGDSDNDGDYPDDNDTNDNDDGDNDNNDIDNDNDGDADNDGAGDSDTEGSSDEDTDADSGEGGEIPECSSSSGTPCKAGGLIWSSRSGTAKNWKNADDDCSKKWSEGRFTSGWRLPTINDIREIIQNCDKTKAGGYCRVTNGCAYKDHPEIFCYTNTSCNSGNNTCSTSEEHSPFGEKGMLWSATIVTDMPTEAWYVNFYNGAISYADKETSYGYNIYYRCVHDIE